MQKEEKKKRPYNTWNNKLLILSFAVAIMACFKVTFLSLRLDNLNTPLKRGTTWSAVELK